MDIKLFQDHRGRVVYVDEDLQIAFGPIMQDQQEAQAFADWLRPHNPLDFDSAGLRAKLAEFWKITAAAKAEVEAEEQEEAGTSGVIGSNA